MLVEALASCTELPAQELFDRDRVVLSQIPDLSGPPQALDSETLLQIRHDLELLAGVER